MGFRFTSGMIPLAKMDGLAMLFRKAGLRPTYATSFNMTKRLLSVPTGWLMLTRNGMFLAAVFLFACIMPRAAAIDDCTEKSGLLPVAVQYVPNEGVRKCVAHIDAAHVVSINFGVFWIEGHHAGLLSSDDNVDDTAVTDRKLIGKLLHALQNAQEGPPQNGGSFGNENPDELKIILKPYGGTVPDPILLRCDYTLPGGCFGPEFFAAMRDVEQYRAEEVRRLIRDHGRQIKSVTLDNAPVSSVERERLIEALGQVDGRAFAFTSNSAKEFCPSLIMQDGKQIIVWFRFLLPGLGDHSKPPLPPALWSAYVAEKKS